MKILHNVLKGVSLTAAMFVFQACYGTPHQGLYEGESVLFKVVSEEGEPLDDIKVMSQTESGMDSVEFDWQLCGFTDESGEIYADIESLAEGTRFRFSDSGAEYALKDTLITDYFDGAVEIVHSKVK